MLFADDIIESLKDKIPELKSKHGDVHLIIAQEADEFCIARPPTRPEFQEFREAIYDEKKRVMANEVLVRSCVVYPDKPSLTSKLDKKPGLAVSFGNKLQQLAGAVETVEVKKL